MFHAIITGPTMADSLIRADTIVLARDDGNYRFEAVELLRGSESAVEIPFLADTAVVRKLSLNPDDAVLFARNPDTGLWRRLAFVDEIMRTFLGDLLEQSAKWSSEYGEARFQFFAALHDHPDPRIRRIAHLDLDLAPYGLLRTLDLRLEARSILLDLRSFSGFQQVPFKFLLLGLSGEEIARQKIHRVVAGGNSLVRSQYLGPAATALMELDGLQGLKQLEQLFLLDPNEPLSNVKKVVQAMAIHSQVGPLELQAGIRNAISRLIAARPETGPIVAMHLTQSENWSYFKLMDRLIMSRKLRTYPEFATVMDYLVFGEASA